MKLRDFELAQSVTRREHNCNRREAREDMKKRLVLFSVAISYLHGCSPAESRIAVVHLRRDSRPGDSRTRDSRGRGSRPGDSRGRGYGCSPAAIPGTTSVDASSMDAEGLEDVGVSATDAGTAPIDAGNTQGGCVLPVRHSGDCACGSHMVCVRSCETVGTTAVAVAFCVDGGLP